MMDKVKVKDPKNLPEWTLQDNATAGVLLGLTLHLCLVQTLQFLSERSRRFQTLPRQRIVALPHGKLKHRPGPDYRRHQYPLKVSH
jgi:hypothetical protein